MVYFNALKGQVFGFFTRQAGILKGFKQIPGTIKLFLKVYLLSVLVFSLFRLILFFTEAGRIDATVSTTDLLTAFAMGFRFDTVITGYIILLPYLVLTVLSFLPYPYEAAKTVLFYCVFALLSVAFLICAIDIPYFNQFFARLSVTAFEWLDSPAFVAKMIVQEPRYWLFILPPAAAVWFMYKALRKIFFVSRLDAPASGRFVQIILSAVFTGLLLLSIRGRAEIKSPIRIGTAYFSNNAFLNQLGLNPNFTLIRSYLDSRKDENRSVTLMNDSQAVANVRQYLGINTPDSRRPLSRIIPGNGAAADKYNVVVVIMESMSAAKMGRHGNTRHLTPFLDSLSNEGYYFENTYTAGIHTFNGIFSTLFSYPALFRQHPMKETSILKFHGISSALKENGYSNIYFTTHDGQFDNVEGFLRANDFENVVTKQDYPPDEVKTTLGVPDDYMFRFSIPVLNKLSENGKPFFAAFMTASDHGPYFIPEYFKPRSAEIKNQAVEYADYSLQKFVQLCSGEKWFGNTIFVFVADHGAPIDATYDLSLSYNHSPLLFYAPGIIREKKVFDKMAGQIDVFPSIMGLLNLPYTNNTLGINLFEENRPYIFFNGDDKYGVIDHEWLLVRRHDKSVSLYKYMDKDTHNYADENPEIVAAMKLYAESNLQAFQYVINTNKQ